MRTSIKTSPGLWKITAALSALLLLCVIAIDAVCQADPPAAAVPAPPLSNLPVREITVFKDGHTFVVREGKAKAWNGGSVLLHDLPNPVLGTYRPFAGDHGVTLSGAVARRDRAPTDLPALSIPDFIALR